MQILKLLSEEIFDYSLGQMTERKKSEMKKNLNSQFTMIFQLCEYVLGNSNDQLLVTITLQTLQKFLHWIPIGYIFKTKLLETLALKFFPISQFQNDTLQCLGEIAGIETKGKSEYTPKVLAMFKAVMQQTGKLIKPTMNVAQLYASGNEKAATFIRYLALFITSFCTPKTHLSELEAGKNEDHIALFSALKFLLMISRVNDMEIWKICLEYWNGLVADLYHSMRVNPAGSLNLGGVREYSSPRVKRYSSILSELRHVMITKMPRPEEVLIHEDENGNIVKQRSKDTDAITLYYRMKEGLVYLTHLDAVDTQSIMLNKLGRQVDGSEWSWNNLNTLCWAIGSISGTLHKHIEKTFLVRVIKDLLQMCDNKQGKDHKAVIASNIMYVVGQYPRFLRKHWKFLKTVVNKLFEFMHEKHEGVQDMSCKTFLKIAQSCRQEFVKQQEEDEGKMQRAFVIEIIERLPQTIEDLEESHIHTFYEAVAGIVRAEQRLQVAQQLIMQLMKLPNSRWAAIITQANRHMESLFDLRVVKSVVNVLKTNNRAATALQHYFDIQLGRIYLEMLQVYKSYSKYVSNEIGKRGANATKTVIVRQMRTVKKETLRLIQTFVANSVQGQHEMIFKRLLPNLLDPVLDDYKRNVPHARDAEVLSLIAELIKTLGPGMSSVIPRILDSTFSCTLDMIKTNLQDFPDVRRTFFEMIRAINARCFQALLALKPVQFKLVMDSICWSIQHLDRTIAEIGLNTMLKMLSNFESSQAAAQFYKTYYMHMLKEILKVLSDTFHKPGFVLHCKLMMKLFVVCQSGAIPVPLWNPKQGNFPNNVQFVQQSVAHLIKNTFKNISTRQAEYFVVGAFKFTSSERDFKRHIRDFLIQLKEFSSDKDDLYLEEKQRMQNEEKKQVNARKEQVPGMIKQS